MFKLDPEFEKNEEVYEEIRKEIIGNADISDEDGGDELDDEEEGSDVEEAPKKTTEIIDNTDQNLTAFRRYSFWVLGRQICKLPVAENLLNLPEKKIPEFI